MSYLGFTNELRVDLLYLLRPKRLAQAQSFAYSNARLRSRSIWTLVCFEFIGTSDYMRLHYCRSRRLSEHVCWVNAHPGTAVGQVTLKSALLPLYVLLCCFSIPLNNNSFQHNASPRMSKGKPVYSSLQILPKPQNTIPRLQLLWSNSRSRTG